MNAMRRTLCGFAVAVAIGLTLAACRTNPPTVTLAGKTVSTLQKTFTMVNCGGTTPRTLPVEPQDWWNTMPAANRQYPFAGWETFQAGVGGCAQTRLDTYRAVVTFNLSAVSNLKGLVTLAELIVATRALPSGVGMSVTSGPFGVAGSINLTCAAMQGGIGGLMRFGPAAAVPTTNPAGNFEMLGTNPFPTGSGTVYMLPVGFVAGPVAGATSPTTATASGNGGATFTTTVTGAITSALNSGATGISWMVLGPFEAPLPGILAASVDTDCRTPIDFNLRLTHN